MNLSLTKLPWYGQIGAFAVLAVAGIGAFIYYYDMPARVEIATRQEQLVVLKKDINRGLNTAKKLSEFQKEVAQLEARLAALSAVLPEGSKGGETSTRSPPTRLSPLQPRMISSACQVVSPPTSTVPVPGAKAGSRLSMS